MNGVDTISLREETTFISCFAYESVHHHHPERERERFPFRNLILQLDDHISLCVHI